MTELIDKMKLLQQIAEFGREIPKDQVIGVIARQESVEVEDRPKGEWVNDEHDIPRCSECGYMPEFNNHIDDYYYSDFCPNCGSDNRERSEE